MELSTYTIFADWCRGKSLTRKRISDMFSRRVDSDDYANKDRDTIIDFLVGLSFENTQKAQK